MNLTKGHKEAEPSKPSISLEMEDHLKCAYLLKDICQSLGALAYMI